MINRNQALGMLENLMKTGFSILTIRGLINKIYDSIENHQFDIKQEIISNHNNPLPVKEILETFQSNIDKNQTLQGDIKEKVLLSFSEVEMLAILNRTDIIAYDKQGYKFEIHSEKYGKLYYFPKADKVQITKTNEWKQPGFHWLHKNI